ARAGAWQRSHGHNCRTRIVSQYLLRPPGALGGASNRRRYISTQKGGGDMALIRQVRMVGLIGALVAALALGGAVPAAADYGNSGGNVQLYQVTASMNCNNPSLCPQPLGGFWAWAVFNQDGTFDGEITF